MSYKKWEAQKGAVNTMDISYTNYNFESICTIYVPYWEIQTLRIRRHTRFAVMPPLPRWSLGFSLLNIFSYSPHITFNHTFSFVNSTYEAVNESGKKSYVYRQRAFTVSVTKQLLLYQKLYISSISLNTLKNNLPVI